MEKPQRPSTAKKHDVSPKTYRNLEHDLSRYGDVMMGQKQTTAHVQKTAAQDTPEVDSLAEELESMASATSVKGNGACTAPMEREGLTREEPWHALASGRKGAGRESGNKAGVHAGRKPVDKLPATPA